MEYSDRMTLFVKKWSLEQKYLIFGTSNAADYFLDKMKGKVRLLGFIDSDAKKWGKEFKGHRINSFPYWKEHAETAKIIVASGAYTEIRQMLRDNGYREEEDFCDSRAFLINHMMIQENKLYLYRTDICITERCNLKCRNCNMLMPYFENPVHRSLEELKEDLDTYFTWVDGVQNLNLLGGEPFVYPQVEDYTRYLCEHYRDRVRQIEFFTNGLVTLKESMLQLIKNENISIQLSDYRNGIPAVGEKVDHFIQVLKEYEIPYRHNIDNQWLDFGFPNYVNPRDLEELKVFFRECYSPFRGLREKKLYYCHLNTSAVHAHLFPDMKDDYFDLSVYDEGKKIELAEFDLGYIKRGFITYCRKCKGCFAVNSEYVSVAEQK